MGSVLLRDGNLNCGEIITSLFLSEYAMRHLKEAKKSPHGKWGHRIVAVLQFCPVVGLIATWIEFILIKVKNIKPVWIARGDQSDCDGSVSLAKTNQICSFLNTVAPPTILFDPSKISSEINGGTCSAMSLDFAATYFKLRKKHREEGEKNPKRLLSQIKTATTRFQASGEDFRVVQQAFNAITVVPGEEGSDIPRDKIEALSSYYHLMVLNGSDQLDMNAKGTTKKIQRMIDSLPFGVYVLRMLQPLDNEKQEKHGHTMIYVKEEGFDLFYEPNYGLEDLSWKIPSSRIIKRMKSSHRKFTIPLARFYQVEEINCTQGVSKIGIST